MSIFFLTLYIMLWTLGICASYAFVMTIAKKDASLSFLRQSSLAAFLSYGAAWFFGVLYYIHPDTIARFAHAATPSANVWLQTFFMQSRGHIFFSFVAVPVLAGVLASLIFRFQGADDFAGKKSSLFVLSIIANVCGVMAILLAQMIA